jgi:class 3 adenylate cyclase
MRLLNSLSIKSKLIAMLLLVSGCSIVVTTYLGYRSGQQNLTDRVFSQLTSVRASKAYQIESYFKNIRNHTQTLGDDPSIVTAMQDFTAAYSKLQTVPIDPRFDLQIATYYRDSFLKRLATTTSGTAVLEAYTPKDPAARYLQYHYIAANPNPVGKKLVLDDPRDGSDYTRLHGKYHPIFRNIVQKFGYYDMFPIDPNGTVVYTVFKETDFTTNYQTGAYRDSNLAQLRATIQAANQRNYAQLIDFAPYAPSYGAPAAFIAAPIFNKSQFIGVLAFQLPVDEINNVMTGNRQWSSDGLGKSGETYLVGHDYLMRSVSRFLIEDPKGYAATLRALGTSPQTIERIERYGTSILQQPVRSTAVVEAIAGKQGTQQIVSDYRNIPVLSSYAPLKLGDLDWVVVAEMDLAEAYSPIYEFERQILISAVIILLLVTLLAMGLANIFVRPINQLIGSARRVAAGELETIATLDSGDEFGELASSFNAMVTSLRTQTNLVEQKNQENEQLLLSIFPSAIAKRLKQGEKDIAEDISNVTVLFSDLTGFSKLSSTLTAFEIVRILNDLVAAFDEAADRYGMEKIKTIGDSYLAICGLSIPYLDHDKRAVDFALEMLAIIRRFDYERSLHLNMRIAINSGDVVAGIVGKNRFIYDVWGDTINTARDLRLACQPGSLLVTASLYQRLHDLYHFHPLPDVEIYGKPKVSAWRLDSFPSTAIAVDRQGVV